MPRANSQIKILLSLLAYVYPASCSSRSTSKLPNQAFAFASCFHLSSLLRGALSIRLGLLRLLVVFSTGCERSREPQGGATAPNPSRTGSERTSGPSGAVFFYSSKLPNQAFDQQTPKSGFIFSLNNSGFCSTGSQYSGRRPVRSSPI